MKHIIFFILCISSIKIFAQKQDKIAGYLWFDYSTTMYDRTQGNNPSGVGIGAQVIMKTKTAFEPLIKIEAQGSLENDDVYRLTPSGKGVPDARGIINVFAGSSFNPSRYLYVSFLLGPSFINNNSYLGIEPSIGIYFSKRKRVTAQVSYLNIFNRKLNYEETKKIDFGALNLGLGIKLF